MERLFILGFLCILIVNAQDVGDEITVEYATVTKMTQGQGNPDSLILSLCKVNVPNDPELTLVPELTIQLAGQGSDPDSVENINGEKKDSCFDFNFSDHEQFMEKQNDIYLKVKETTLYEGKKEKETIHEFRGKFTFKESKADIDVKFYNDVNIIQFKNGEVAAFRVDEGSITTPQCNTNKDLCVSPNVGKLSDTQKVKIYNGETDTIPNSNPKSLVDSIRQCDAIFNIIAVYDNDDDVVNKGFKITADPVGDIANFYAVSNNVLFDLATKKIPSTEDFKVIKHTENKCEKISATVRDMTFVEPFTDTVEVSWAKDNGGMFFLEVTEVGGSPPFSKNLHIDCSQGDLETCIAYIFSAELENKQLDYLLSESDESEPNKPTAGKSKTKQTYTYTKTDTSKSLKALNLNQFDINWNTKKGKLCVEDALYEKNKKSQFRYELVIGFDNGNWKKHIANYNDESTICFNDFEITQLIENKLGVHFLVMKRDLDTNQILASDMITTDLIVPEISEVNDETISLEFENLNSPFLIRDEKTKNIISKNEKKIHNLAFLKSSHENKSVFNKKLVLETRKEHTQMKVHFKIPQKVNAS